MTFHGDATALEAHAPNLRQGQAQHGTVVHSIYLVGSDCLKAKQTL